LIGMLLRVVQPHYVLVVPRLNLFPSVSELSLKALEEVLQVFSGTPRYLLSVFVIF